MLIIAYTLSRETTGNPAASKPGRCELLVTGHSLGGMLAMTVASRSSTVKALSFAPTPWKHLSSQAG